MKPLKDMSWENYKERRALMQKRGAMIERVCVWGCVAFVASLWALAWGLGR